MLETITAVNQAVNSFIWGIPAMVCIIGVGLLLSVRTGFLQIRKFPYAIRTTIGRIFRRKDASDGAMTPFQAVCTALAATVGTGNIAGVAGAIAIGGPGAVFWMWCSALLGMCTKFAEVTLAVHFRERNKNGELVGGPMYYIKNGLGSRWQFLAVLYSLFGVLTVFGTGNATQVNTIVTAIDSALLATGSGLNGILPTLNLIVGVVVAMMVAMVLLGGVKRIGSVTEKLVPFMALFYVVLALGVVVINYRRFPAVLASIVGGAFDPQAFTGGAIGSIFLSMQKGVSRGIFSNEAGLGTGSIARTMAAEFAKVPAFHCAAVCSRQKATGEALAQQFGIPKVYTDYDAMLADPDIELVYIATPNSLHYAQTKAALLAGKNVLCEKPFVPTVAEADELIALAKEKHLFLFEAITTAHHPNYALAKQYLDDIGSLRIVSCTFCQYSSRYDALLSGQVPPVFDPACCGGALMDLNLYNVHFVVGLFGEPMLVSYHPNLYRNGIDTSGILLLEYPDFLCQCTGAKDCAAPGSVQLVGEKGRILIEPGSSNCRKLLLDRPGQETFSRECDESPWYYEVSDIAALLAAKDYDACYQALEKTRQVVSVLEAARQDAQLDF